MIFAMLITTCIPILSQDFPEIITPNGSETLYVGANYEIEWTGISPADTVTIEYSLDRCSNWIMITEKATGLKYTWKNIPNTISNNCLLRIRKYKKFTAGVENGFVQMTGHNGRVFAAKYSPNGLFAATGSGDTKMIIWDVVNNSIYKDVTINSGDIYGISYSRDGYEIATSHASGKAMIWNAINGKKISELSGVFSGWCNFSVFNPNDCNIIASGDGGGNLIVWNKITKTIKYKVKAHNALLHQVDYSPDGKYIATAGYDYLVKIWDAETGQLVKTLTDHNAAVYSAMWSPNGQYLSACGGIGDLKVNIWETKNWTLVNSMSGHTNKINSVPWNKDNNKVLSSSDDGSAIEWDVFNGIILRVLNNQVSGIYFADYSPKNSRIITAGLDATVNIYGKDTLDYTEDISENVWSIVPSACTPIEVLTITRPNGKERFKVGSSELIEWTGIAANDTVTIEYSMDKCRTWIPIANKATGLKYLWQNIPNTISDYCLLRVRRYKNFETNALDTVTILQAHNSNVYRIAWSKDGTKSVSISRDGTVIIWDAVCKKKISTYKSNFQLYALALNYDGTLVALGNEKGDIEIIKVKDGSILFSIPNGSIYGHQNKLFAGLSWANECNRLASCTDDMTMKTFEIDPYKDIKIFNVKTYSGHTQMVHGVQWSPDDKQLVTASWDKTIKIWDYETTSNLFTYNGHKSYTYYAYWSPDGKKIASSSGVGELEIHIWDAQTGNLEKSFSGHTNKINTVPWSPDGKKILSSSDDGTIIEWDVANGNKLRTFNDLSSGVYFADYSPFGGRIFAGAVDGKVAFYGKDIIPYIEDMSDLAWAIVPAPTTPCGFSAFDYKSFKANTNVVLKEDTKLKDSSISLLKLQPFAQGAVLNKSKVFFKNGFTTSFSFSSANGNNNQNYDASLPGADGVTLVMQNNPSPVLGGRGGEIGYNGIPNAIALEIDTYRNGLDYNDINGNHIALQTTKDGKLSSHHDNSLAINNDIFILKDNIRYYVKMDYDVLKKHIDVYLDTNNNLLNKVLSVDNVNLDQIFGSNNGNCWIGITSASGVAFAEYFVHNWSYCEKDGSFISDVKSEQNNTIPNQNEIYSEIIVYNQIGQFIQSGENVSINQLKETLKANEPLFFYCKNNKGSQNYKLIIE